MRVFFYFGRGTTHVICDFALSRLFMEHVVKRQNYRNSDLGLYSFQAFFSYESSTCYVYVVGSTLCFLTFKITSVAEAEHN